MKGIQLLLSMALCGVTPLTLTTDGTDTYTFKVSGAGILVAARTGNIGSNLRNVYIPNGQPPRSTSRVCSTWTVATADSIQQGHAHNVGGGRAVTVTKNVIYGIHWVFNVHTWDNSAFTQVAQFDMIDVMFTPTGALKPLPWRVCTEVKGATLRFKIWFPPEREPAWTDATRTRTMTLPTTHTGPGLAGLYAGHIPPGGWLTYTGMEVS